MKSLLLLPCNPGAKDGNYFTGQVWKRFDAALKERSIREQVDIAAIDCIIAFQVRDGKGAIVLETEMDRVKGYDAHPSSILKTSWAWDRERKLRLLTDEIKIGLQRVHDNYSQIIAVMNPPAYKICLVKAVRELRLGEKATMFDWLVCGFAIPTPVLNAALDALSSNSPTRAIFWIDSRYRWTSEETRQNAERIFEASFSKVPQAWRFWEPGTPLKWPDAVNVEEGLRV